MESPRGLIAKILNYGLEVNEFKLYYIHFQTNIFGKGMNPLILANKEAHTFPKDIN